MQLSGFDGMGGKATSLQAGQRRLTSLNAVRDRLLIFAGRQDKHSATAVRIQLSHIFLHLHGLLLAIIELEFAQMIHEKDLCDLHTLLQIFTQDSEQLLLRGVGILLPQLIY